MRSLVAIAAVAALSGCASHNTASPISAIDPPAERVAREFIRTTVERQDLAAGWRLADVQLRSGFTPRTWRTKPIPVQWYPADPSMPYGFKIERSEGDTLTLEVYLSSRRVDVRPQLFWIVLKRRGGSWRVDGFLPAASPSIVPAVAKR